MADHIVKAHGEALERLAADVARMGEVTVEQLRHAIQAITLHDAVLAQAVRARDPELDGMESDIEHAAVRLIALRQPMAVDLRHALAAMKVASNLERCGDLAKNIAKRILAITASSRQDHLTDAVTRLGSLAISRLRQVLAAYSAGDVDEALAVWREDDLIDDQFDALFNALVQSMSKDPATVSDCAHLLFVAKNLERVGDHATNIAELVVYQVTGETIANSERPRGGATAS